MIIELLSNRFPSEFSLDSIDISHYLTEKRDSFSLSDKKACIPCKKRREDRACKEEVLNIHSSIDISVLDFEKYIEQFSETSLDIKNICDYMLFDENSNHYKNKIAFCDLTCSDKEWVESNTGKYPEGKRAKAKSQMLDSLEYLLKNPLLAVDILTFPKKVCLFGWRDFDNPDEATVSPVHNNNVMKNMQVFGRTPSSMAKLLTSEKPEHGFSFVQVKYPSVYEF